MSKTGGDVPSVYTDRCLEAIGRFTVLEIQLVVDYDGPVDQELLARALRLLLDAEPILGCRFVPRFNRPRWRPIPPEILDRERLLFMKDARADRPGDDELEPFLVEPFSEERGPQVHALLLRGKRRDRLVLKVHHLPADTGATKQVAARLAQIYRRLGRDAGYRPAPNDGSRGISQVFRGIGPARLASLFGRGALRQARNGLPIRVARFEVTGAAVGRPGYVLLHFPATRVVEILEHCRRKGATINDVFVAATLRAIAQVDPRDGACLHRLTTTVDLRRHLPRKDQVGITNLTSFVYVDLGAQLGRDFAETLASVKAWMDSEKRELIGLDVHAFLRTLDAVLPSALLRRVVGSSCEVQERGSSFATSLTNLGPIDLSSLGLAGPQATGAFIVAPASRPPAFALGLSGDGTRLTLSAGFYESALERSRVGSLLQAIDRQLPGASPFA